MRINIYVFCVCPETAVSNIYIHIHNVSQSNIYIIRIQSGAEQSRERKTGSRGEKPSTAIKLEAEK